MLQAGTVIELLNKVEVQNLYVQLIQQLNKDFQLANIDEYFEETTPSTDLHTVLSQILLKLINNQYDDYLNLLYRVDISEVELLKVRSENLEESVQQVAFLLLKREVQKVWLRKNYSNL